jgi:hypothetical protein
MGEENCVVGRRLVAIHAGRLFLVRTLIYRWCVLRFALALERRVGVVSPPW